MHSFQAKIEAREIVVALQILQSPGVLEHELKLRAGDHTAAGEDKQRGRRGLDQAL